MSPLGFHICHLCQRHAENSTVLQRKWLFLQSPGDQYIAGMSKRPIFCDSNRIGLASPTIQTLQTSWVAPDSRTNGDMANWRARQLIVLQSSMCQWWAKDEAVTAGPRRELQQSSVIGTSFWRLGVVPYGRRYQRCFCHIGRIRYAPATPRGSYRYSCKWSWLREENCETESGYICAIKVWKRSNSPAKITLILEMES